MGQAEAGEMTLTFRCPPELLGLLPEPIPAVQGLPDWFKAMPQRVVNPRSGYEQETLKRCPPFIDAMTYGFLILLATDLKVQDGEFSWDFEVPRGSGSTIRCRLSTSTIRSRRSGRRSSTTTATSSSSRISGPSKRRRGFPCCSLIR